MMLAARWSLSLVIAGLIVAAAFAQPKLTPTADRIRDAAGLFGAEAKSKAEAQAKQIADKYKTEVVVETVASVDVPATTKAPKEIAAYMDRWALSRFKMEGHKGIYVVIAKEPPKVRVVYANKLGTRFGAADADKVEGVMVEHLKASRKEPARADRALLEGLDLIAATLQARPATAAGGDAEPRVNWVTWLLVGVGAFLVIWLIMAVIRGLSGMNASPAGQPGTAGYGGGGGGFMSSFLAGMFGAAAGMWMYQSFFGGANQAHAAPPADPSAGAAGDPGGASVAGGDWGDSASTGDTARGDWGDNDAGGGDAGGGDAGGGDFGGGDYGGDFGGGDW